MTELENVSNASYESMFNNAKLNDVLEEGEVPQNLQSKTTDSVNSVNSDKTDDTLKNDASEWVDILGSGSVMKKIIKEGSPETRPKRFQNCKIRYSCTLEDGTVVEKKDNFVFQLGDCEVVQGLDLVIGLMNVEETCELKIEPRLAYGPKGLEPLVAPNTTVFYEVELISVEPEEDPENLTIIQRKDMGNKKRERGNWWYGRGENTLAIQCYRRALDYLDEVEGGITDPLQDGQTEVTDAALQELLEDRVSVCNNMAAAQLKMGLHEAALNSLQIVLRCQPDNVKALFRKAKVYRAKNDLPTALKCLQKANDVAPKNVDVQKETLVVTSLMQKQKVSERELARRMFNGPKSSDCTKRKSQFSKDSNKLYLWATLGASIAVGLVGLAAYKFKM